MKDMNLDFIPDLPKGPLDEYRHPSIDWKRLKIYLEGEEAVRVKYHTFKIMEEEPIFDRPHPNLSSDEQKRIAAVQMMKIKEMNMCPPEIYELDFRPRYRYLMAVNECLHAYSPSLAVKIALGVGLFQNGLLAMGTKKHMDFYTKAWTREIVTCLAITEVSHGSNTKQIRTTATFDKATQEFVIHTPDFEAAKCWVGNLGKTATVALLFAILITSDGQEHGLHGFLVNIRDPNTLKPYPGVLVGDMGEKIGLHGIDNGWLMFNNYRIPRDGLLNKTSDVSPEGELISVFSDPSKMLGAALESLLTGRLGICSEAVGTLSFASVIATRYAAIRKQFPLQRGDNEIPIIEYQLHQWRIFPYLAAACVLKVATQNLTEAYYEVIEISHSENADFEELSNRVAELHALVSTFKPLTTWMARDAVQEAREACGGHGYLKAANLGELRANNDPALTYEGDNNVLSQQTSNWLMKQWRVPDTPNSPLGTANFLMRKKEIRGRTYEKVVKEHGAESFKFFESCYEWLMCHLMQSIADQLEEEKCAGRNFVDAKNRTQVYKALVLVKAYAEYNILKAFPRKLNADKVQDPEMASCLLIAYRIYAFNSLEKHLIYFHEGNFTTGPQMVNSVRNSLLKNCDLMKKYCVTIADALAPPDFILNSVIAKADGRLYQNLQNELMATPGGLERPSWWQEVLPIRKSKL